MNRKNIFFFLMLILSWHFSLFPSILSGTLVETPQGLVEVEELCIGDYVTSFDFEAGEEIEVKITYLSKGIIDGVVVIETEDGLLYAPKDQLFFLSDMNAFVQAQELEEGDILLNIDGDDIFCLSIEFLPIPAIKYDITIESPHIFFINMIRIPRWLLSPGMNGHPY